MHKVELPVDVTAVVLAGGLATRLGGVDKGLQSLNDKLLIQHVLDRIEPQVGYILINCNRNLDRYGQFGHMLVPDRLTDFPGPLAGLHAASHSTRTDLLATVPCDAPFLPLDLVARLLNNLSCAPAVFACSPEQQPVFALYRRSALEPLEAFLASGKRSVAHWLKHIGARAVDFSDRSDAFRNLNSADDWPRC